MLDRPLEHDYWDQNQSVLGMDYSVEALCLPYLAASS